MPFDASASRENHYEMEVYYEKSINKICRTKAKGRR